MKLHTTVIPGIVFVYCAVLFPPVAVAQADKAQLQRCYAIANINDKVSCYDNLARPQVQQSESASQSAAPAVAQPAMPTLRVESAAPAEAAASPRNDTAAAKVERFGQQAKVEADDQGEETLVGKVATIARVEPNKMQITLANGQVWKQSVGKNFRLEENDMVRISRSPWGSSFRLARDGVPGFIQVQRLR